MKEIRCEAALNLQQWAKGNISENVMKLSIERYMDVSGANESICGNEGILCNRRICANELLLDSITPLTKEELKVADKMVMEIANTLPA